MNNGDIYLIYFDENLTFCGWINNETHGEWFQRILLIMPQNNICILDIYNINKLKSCMQTLWNLNGYKICNTFITLKQ